MNKMSSKAEILICLLLFIVIVGARAIHLDADPPIGLSISSDVYTDTPNLTLYAKHQVNNNEIVQTDGTRFTLFHKSSITALGFLIFSLFGVSLASSNLIGLFFSLGCLFLFFLITRKSAGSLAGILYLIIIGLNYNQIFYGRLAFQEHSMIFWGALAFVLVQYFENKYVASIAGIALGCSIFFGKMIGVVFIVPFMVYFLYEIYSLKKNKLKSIYFASGFILISLSWLLFVYLPMLTNVNSYLSEQIYNNHGFPVAFESVSKFIGMYVTFGHISHLIERNFIVCLLASLFIVAFLYNIFPTKKDKEKIILFNSDILFIVSLAISFYLFLMIWKYRPLRYQLVLLYPICSIASILITRLWQGEELWKNENIRYKLFFILLPITILYSAFTVFKYQDILFQGFTYTIQQVIIYSGMVLYALLIYFSIYFWSKWKSLKKILLMRFIISIALLIIVGLNSYRYYNWIIRPTYTVRDNSRDLSTILNKNAVLAGSYATPLTIETKYSSIIHMFGVTNPDPDLFKKTAITHILVNSSEEAIARKDYSEIVEKSHTVLTYYINGTIVYLLRVAGHTGNPIADTYELSTFEQLALANENNDDSSYTFFYNKYTSEYPDNISGYYTHAKHTLAKNNIKESEKSILKALEFSPSNYTLLAVCARFYKNLYKNIKAPRYKTQGIIYYKKALKLFPTSESLQTELENLEYSR